MPADKARRLKVWTGEPEALSDQEPELPKPWGVLYAAPNPDGSRKLCRNCYLWSLDQRCGIHDEDLVVEEDAVCGYHVYGTPSKERVHYPDLQPVDPATSGLEQVPEGTSCNLCKFYDPRSPVLGVCYGVRDPEQKAPAVVEALGCCARWER